jgi:hypothetical protein
MPDGLGDDATPASLARLVQQAGSRGQGRGGPAASAPARPAAVDGGPAAAAASALAAGGEAAGPGPFRPAKVCAGCGKTGAPKHKLCARCNAARYCSKECQKAHWLGGHKAECAAAAGGEGVL